MIPIYNVDISMYKKSVHEAIDSNWISNHGEFIDRATQSLKEILETDYVILMANGTCATHCLFKALRYAHPTITKIYLPNNVYVAAWNACMLEYSYDSTKENNIEIMKIDENTLNIDTSEDVIMSLETNSAVLIVHNCGNVINVKRLMRLRPDIVFLEDNCEGFSGRYEDEYTGTNALCSSMSFYGNKIVTTGEGGAFATRHKHIYDYIHRFYNQGNSEIRYVHDMLGVNYRMTNLQAALLYDQLSCFDSILMDKERIFYYYDMLFKHLAYIGIVRHIQSESKTKRAHWIYTIKLMNAASKNKLTFHEFARENGVETREFFYPIQTHGHLQQIKTPDDTSSLQKQVIMLPSYIGITLAQQKYIVELFYKYHLDIQDIKEDNIADLEEFVKSMDTKFFTYFMKREIGIVHEHLRTVGVYENNQMIAYAHINRDYWIGLYVDEAFRNRGIAKSLLSYLIFISDHELYLSVYKDNTNAIQLYDSYGFIKFSETDRSILMKY